MRPATVSEVSFDRLVLTRQFARSAAARSAFTRKHCTRALRRLLTGERNQPHRPRSLISPAGYHELRCGYRDRAILRIEGATIIVVDVLDAREIARLNAGAFLRLPPHARSRLNPVRRRLT